MATPVMPLDNYDSLENPPTPSIPGDALVWLEHQYCNSKGWTAMSGGVDLTLHKTIFDDGRLEFLDSVPGNLPPEEFKANYDGKFDVKTWRKGDKIIAVEGDNKVHFCKEKDGLCTAWYSPERLPTYTTSWRPIMFNANKDYDVIRYAPESALISIGSNRENTPPRKKKIPYSNGFVCLHPVLGTAIVYGAYSPKEEIISSPSSVFPLNILRGPKGGSDGGMGSSANGGATDSTGNVSLGSNKLISLPGNSTNDYFIQLYPWGFLVIPKQVTIINPGVLCGTSSSELGRMYIPPNVLVPIHVKPPCKYMKELEYIKDFTITCRKINECDFDIYLVLDGALVCYRFSYDIRTQHDANPQTKINANIKTMLSQAEKDKMKQAKIDKQPYVPKISFQKTNTTTPIVSEGTPTDQGHMCSDQCLAIFDCFSGSYLVNGIGIKSSKLFSKIQGEHSPMKAAPSCGKPSQSPNSSQTMSKPPEPILPAGLPPTKTSGDKEGDLQDAPQAIVPQPEPTPQPA